MRIVAIGHLTLDEVVVPGHPARVRHLGGAAYVAAGAALWGTQVAVCSAVGGDARGELHQLAQRGIDVDAVTVVDGATLRMTVDGDGADRRFAVVAGEVASLEDAWPAPDVHGPVDGCHLGPQIGTAARRAAARRTAHRLTADVLVDDRLPSLPYRDGTALRGVDAFLPSEDDVARLWGRAVPAGQLRASLAEGGVGAVVVTCGPQGARVATASGVAHVPSAAREVVDALGAGDAFCGGYLAGLLATDDPVEAAVRGSVSAAVTIGTRGAIAALDAARDASGHGTGRDGREALAAAVRRAVMSG